MIRRVTYALVLALFTCSVFSQITPSEFVKMFGNSDYNHPFNRENTLSDYDSQNGEFVIFSNTDKVLFKLDQNGDVLWQNDLNIPDVVYDVMVLPNRNIIVLQAANTTQGHQHDHFDLISFDQNGNQNWSKTYNITGGYFHPKMTYYLNDIVIVYSMNLSGTQGNDEMGIVRLNNSGNTVWHYEYSVQHSNGTDVYISQTFNSSNNIDGFLITSRKFSPSSVQTIFQIDLNGNVLMAQEVNCGAVTFNREVFETTQGDYLLTSSVNSDLYITKFDANWNTLWNHYIPNHGALSIEGVTFADDGNGNIFMTSHNSGTSNILRINSQGVIVKEALFNSYSTRFMRSGDVIGDKLVFMGADDVCTGFGNSDVIVAAVDSTLTNCNFETPSTGLSFQTGSPFTITTITVTRQTLSSPSNSNYNVTTTNPGYLTSDYPRLNGCNGSTCLDTANFSYTSTCLSDGVKFFDLSSTIQATSPSWTWDFGDGVSSTQQHPTHVYSTPGQYTVELTYEYLDGACTCSDVIQKVIEVLDTTSTLLPLDICEFDKWYGDAEYNNGMKGLMIDNHTVTAGFRTNTTENANNINLMRLDDMGEIIWNTHVYDTKSKIIRDLELLDNGNILLAVDTNVGESNLVGSGDFELYCFDQTNGNLIWHKRYDFGFDDRNPFLFNQAGESTVDLFFNKGITDTTFNLGFINIDYNGNINERTEYVVGIHEDYYHKVKDFSGAGYIAVGAYRTDSLNSGLIVTLDRNASLQRAVHMADGDSMNSELLDVVTYDLECNGPENDMNFATVGQKIDLTQNPNVTDLVITKFDENINMQWNRHLFQLNASWTNGGLRSLNTDSEKNLYLTYLKYVNGGFSKRIYKVKDNTFNGTGVWTKEFITDYNLDNLERLEYRDGYRYFGRIYNQGFGNTDFVFGVVDTSFSSCLLQPAVTPTTSTANKTFYLFENLNHSEMSFSGNPITQGLIQQGLSYLDTVVCADCVPIDPCLDTCTTCLIPTEGETYTLTVDVRDIYFLPNNVQGDTDTAYISVRFPQTDSIAGPFYPTNYGITNNTITAQFVYPIGLDANALEVRFHFRSRGVRFGDLRITPSSGSPVYIYDKTIHRFREE
ncbi:MAG: PKD domain-containing protein [Flavobacteriales bacterium]|nr:PKD domain-containing protein [Flavobacteriales bacterium]